MDENKLPKNTKGRHIGPILYIIIGLTIAGFLISIYLYRTNFNGIRYFTESLLKINTAKPAIIYKPVPAPIAQGKQVYNISSPNESPGPRISQLTIDPFDPKIGMLQTMDVKAVDSGGVGSVTLDLRTDNNIKTISMKLIEGTKLNGIWSATWKTEDTHDYKYSALIAATGKSGTSKVEPMFR